MIEPGMNLLLLRSEVDAKADVRLGWLRATVVRKAQKGDRVLDNKGKVLKKHPKIGAWVLRLQSGVYDGAVLTPSGYRSARAGAGWLLAPAGAPASDGAPASFNLPLKKQPAGPADAPASLVKKEPAASLSANALTCDCGPGGMQRTSGLHSEFCALAAGTGSHPAAELAACTDGRHPAAGSSSGIIRSRDDGEPAGARVHDSPPRKRTQRSDDPVPGSICIYHVLEEPRETVRAALVLCFGSGTRSLLLWHHSHNSTVTQTADMPIRLQNVVAEYTTFDKSGKQQSHVTPAPRNRLAVLRSVSCYTVGLDIELIVPNTKLVVSAHYTRVSESACEAVDAWQQSEIDHSPAPFLPIRSIEELDTGRTTVGVAPDGHCALSALTLGLASINQLPFDAGVHLRGGLGVPSPSDIFQLRQFIAAKWPLYLNYVYFLLMRAGTGDRARSYNSNLYAALQLRAEQIGLSVDACSQVVFVLSPHPVFLRFMTILSCQFAGGSAWMGACDFEPGQGADFRVLALATQTPVFVVDPGEIDQVYEYQADGTFLSRFHAGKRAPANSPLLSGDATDIDGELEVCEHPSSWSSETYAASGRDGPIPMSAFPLHSVVLLKSPVHYDVSVLK